MTLYQTAIYAAKQAGKILIENFNKLSASDIDRKAQFDYVTKVDTDCEKKIVDIIHQNFPGHSILAEEGNRAESGGYRWIIDPLDGTTNYIHNVPVYSVSIAVEYDGEIILGIVYDPSREELFMAEKGRGAFLNDQRISVSDIKEPDMALFATGYPFRVKHLIDPYQESFKQLFMQISGIRRTGSAALDFCYIACGRYDGFWELDLHPWDLAAGYLIIEEANGHMSDFAGKDNMLVTGNTIASNGHLHDFIVHTVQNVFRGVVDQ